MPCDLIGISQPRCREHGDTVSLRCSRENFPSGRAVLSLIEMYVQGGITFQHLAEAMGEPPLFLETVLERAVDRLRGRSR